ncbi:membrane protein insertase YidC [Frankia sp. R82]|uniref:membrane protein insertase YidC n=1 Tax=Frankia sp. R82 TaxID=2950553 RepID=UPI00204369A6|nr:membrane protein insertase YidC [Frankia sp. R82]MCM3887299.1 membrane protein insertase YidC [Frankia sp. R82]
MLDPLYHLAANAIVFFHKGFGPILGENNFFAWAFSVILLVVCVRLLIFPLFVKQVKSQRTMQMMQPRIKEIREKYGNDKQRMQQEIMALQREHGNPLLGCLPILLQIPLFISLFHVFTHLAPVNGQWRPRVGLSAHQVQQIASARVGGISLASSFNSDAKLVELLDINTTHVRILAVILIVLMGFTTYMTQRQIMARNGPVDPQQALVQKVLLYGSPIMLAVFGFRFPVAVLLYWLTTNLWSMGQQFFVIKKMPPIKPLSASGRPAGARASGEGTTPGPARPAPGVRAGAKAKNRPRPATTGSGSEGPSLTKAAGEATSAATAKTASGSSTAPPGTRSRSGAARSSVKSTGAATGAARSAPKSTETSAGAAASVATGAAPDSAAPTAGQPGSAAGPGVRRQVGGSRPAKKQRGKGKRPGGRR